MKTFITVLLIMVMSFGCNSALDEIEPQIEDKVFESDEPEFSETYGGEVEG